jgi:hypothetical protein
MPFVRGIKMKKWNERIPEIANLLNPAFCASVIYSVSFEYQKRKGVPMPFVLAYLILPIILHKTTRERIKSQTNMIVWLQKFPDVLINFPKRAKSLVPFANEALEYMLMQNIAVFENGKINIIKTLSKSAMEKSTDDEILECYKKSEHLGRWFAQIGIVENIYAAWGVKP